MPTLPYSSPILGKFNATPIYAYDSSISGYRPMATSDFAGGSGGAGSSTITNFLGTTTLPISITPVDIAISGQQIYTSNGQVFAATPRNIVHIQNLSASGALYVSFSGAASPSNASVILKAGSVDNDGNGGIFDTDIITGALNCSGVNATRFIAWQG